MSGLSHCFLLPSPGTLAMCLCIFGEVACTRFIFGKKFGPETEIEPATFCSQFCVLPTGLSAISPKIENSKNTNYLKNLENPEC